MTPEFKNTFSWSVSRDTVFRECPRKYFFNYYGHWGGWLKDAPGRTREIYVLKQLKNRATWVGQVVHECIARTLQNISRGVPILGTEEILSITRNIMRQDFRHSRSGRYRENPKTYCGLFEHEYDVEVADEEWKNTADDAASCLETFYRSDQFAGLKATLPSSFLEVEQFSSIHLDGVELKIKLDCAVKENDGITIWDWKTGKKESDSGLSLQMACYGLYAQKTYRVPVDKVVTRRFDLHRGIVHEHRLTNRSLDEILAYIRGSISDMTALLTDPAGNRAEEAAFAKVERKEICRQCSFFKVCMPNI